MGGEKLIDGKLLELGTARVLVENGSYDIYDEYGDVFLSREEAALVAEAILSNENPASTTNGPAPDLYKQRRIDAYMQSIKQLTGDPEDNARQKLEHALAQMAAVDAHLEQGK